MYPKDLFTQKTYLPKRRIYPKDVFTRKMPLFTTPPIHHTTKQILFDSLDRNVVVKLLFADH